MSEGLQREVRFTRLHFVMRLTRSAEVDKRRIFSTTERCVHTERMGLESMRIVTGCKTPEQFVAVFHRFCDAKTCFIPTSDTRPVGSALAFSLRLADGTPMLRGTCVVKAAWPTKENAFKRPGVQLEIDKLSTESEPLYEQLLSQKTVVTPASDGVVEEVKPVTTNQHVPRDKAIDLILKQGNAPAIKIPMKPIALPDRKATEQIAKLDRAERAPTEQDAGTPTVQMEPLQMEKRAAGSAIVLPANPLSEIDDTALDEMLGCTLADDGEPLPDDDLAIPVAPRDAIATVLGVAPLAKVKTKPKTKTAPFPVLRADSVPIAIANDGTAPLAFASRPPAAPSMFRLRAMTGDERFWYLCALGAALFVATLVLMTTLVFA